MTLTLSCWAVAAAAIGHRSGATIADRLGPLRDRLVTSHVTVQPAAATSLGQLHHALGDLDEAERSFALADEVHRRLESAFLVLYSDVGRAALLADRAGPGEREEAKVLAEGVLAASEANEYGYLAADARAVLERLEGAT
jgi:ATP/maltotriose-dependent transcriptional regulator MalT